MYYVNQHVEDMEYAQNSVLLTLLFSNQAYTKAQIKLVKFSKS